MKKSKKMKKSKLQTKATIDKRIARALFLTKGEMKTYSIDGVYYNAEEKELVATDSRLLFVIKLKPVALMPLNLKGGLYDIIGNVLILKTEDREKEIEFPKYRDVILIGAKEICRGDILSGIVDCMIKGQVHLNIWKFEAILKILNNLSLWWTFTNNSPAERVMMEAENSMYNIKCIVAPIIR